MPRGPGARRNPVGLSPPRTLRVPWMITTQDAGSGPSGSPGCWRCPSDISRPGRATRPLRPVRRSPSPLHREAWPLSRSHPVSDPHAGGCCRGSAHARLDEGHGQVVGGVSVPKEADQAGRPRAGPWTGRWDENNDHAASIRRWELLQRNERRAMPRNPRRLAYPERRGGRSRCCRITQAERRSVMPFGRRPVTWRRPSAPCQRPDSPILGRSAHRPGSATRPHRIWEAAGRILSRARLESERAIPKALGGREGGSHPARTSVRARPSAVSPPTVAGCETWLPGNRCGDGCWASS